MAYWLLKTEPDAYGWNELTKAAGKGDAWTGVRNHIAKRHLQAMKVGDRVFFYHTGEEKQVVGIAEVTREAYPDPTDETAKFVCVDVKAIEPLPQPVTLAAVKQNAELKEMMLARQPRLSVQPVTDREWRIVRRLGGLR